MNRMRFSLYDRRSGLWTISACIFLIYTINTFIFNTTFNESPSTTLVNISWGSISTFNSSLLNSTDFTTLIDLKNFSFLINNKKCSAGENPFILLFVHSAPSNFEKRKTIRNTWGNETRLRILSMRVIFLLGMTNDVHIHKQLQKENILHKDIIQGNFLDSYRNLTYKHVMGLKWVLYFCKDVKYIVKTDDDIFLNTYQLPQMLKTAFGSSSPSSLLVCCQHPYSYAKRSMRSKWRVSFKEYNNRHYPPYCSGWAVLFSPDVIYNLYIQSTQVPYFWIDDVYITGLLAQRIGIYPEDFSERLGLKSSPVERCLQPHRTKEYVLIGPPDSSIETIYKMWNEYINSDQRTVS